MRYSREIGGAKGYRHGKRERQITGTFGTETVSVPRARIEDEDGKVREWRSKALPRYQRLTKAAEALIIGVYLSGTNTWRVKRALFALFKGAVSKDVVSRAWRKVKTDWDVWCARSLAEEDIVRVILDGTVIKTRIDKKATNISVLAAIGVRRDGQKVLLSIKNMGERVPQPGANFSMTLMPAASSAPNLSSWMAPRGWRPRWSRCGGATSPSSAARFTSTATFLVMPPSMFRMSSPKITAT